MTKSLNIHKSRFQYPLFYTLSVIASLQQASINPIQSKWCDFLWTEFHTETIFTHISQLFTRISQHLLYSDIRLQCHKKNLKFTTSNSSRISWHGWLKIWNGSRENCSFQGTATFFIPLVSTKIWTRHECTANKKHF